MEGHIGGETCSTPLPQGKFITIAFALRTSEHCKIMLLSLPAFLLTQAQGAAPWEGLSPAPSLPGGYGLEYCEDDKYFC